MKLVEDIEDLLSKLDLKDQDLSKVNQLIGRLKSEITINEFSLKRMATDRQITERYLSTTISELEEANKTLHKIQQEKLDEKENELKFKSIQINQIVASLPSSIAYIDQNYIYQFTNGLYQEWFDKDEKQMKGMSVEALLGKENFLKRAKPSLDAAFKGEKVWKEITLEIGERVLVLSVTYVPAFNPDGENIGAYVYAEDITKLMNIQQKLELKNKELQSYIQSYLQLEKFSHLASHDLSAPLKNILSFTTLLNNSAKDKLDENELVYLEFINKGTRNMHSTIKSLLDFSLVTNTEPSFQLFDPKLVVDDLLGDIKSSIEESSAEIAIDSLPPTLYADKHLLRQLIQNLLLNAMKFTKKGVKPIVKLYSKEDHYNYWFYIEDNGIGIDEKYVKNIFLVFKRLHTKEEYPGTGIGLAISKKIVDLHKGQINVRSKIGQGSTFFFSVPKHI